MSNEDSNPPKKKPDADASLLKSFIESYDDYITRTNQKSAYYCSYCGSALCLGDCWKYQLSPPPAVYYKAPPWPWPTLVPTAPQKPENLNQDIRQKVERLSKVEPHKPQKPVPDLVEPITAWRIWKIVGDRLYGVGYNTPWESRKPMKALCENHGRGEHEIPGRSCSCGIWGYKERDKLLDEASTTYGYVPLCVGLVSLWGRVIEHELGFRAEYAYPKELWLLDKQNECAGLRYNVPVRSL